MNIYGNVYLVGFMGAGKSAVGRELSRLLNRELVDMDAVLEAELGKPVREVFAQDGESFFREAESRLLDRLADRGRLVVATGGGVPEREDNRGRMRRSGQLVHLHADFESCRARLADEARNSRPLWRDEAAVKELFASRESLYGDGAIRIETDGQEPAAIARIIAERLFGAGDFDLQLGGTNCPVSATFDAPGKLALMIRDRRVALITDRNVERFHGTRYSGLSNVALKLVFPGGERTKSLRSVERIYRGLLAQHFDRDDLLIALGGGVMTDLGAYAAATYKRGMSFILVSTSLLGCVDAAVGGKSAVNLGTAKNMIGCFTVPERVVLDLPAMITLKPHHIREGLVEAYKTGLVCAPELAALIEQNGQALIGKDMPTLARLAALSAQAKGSVVARDFMESGWRGILNFGHTYGHAVESWNRFRVSHGQAVALGMKVAADLSHRRGLIGDDLYRRIHRTLTRVSPKSPTAPPVEEAWPIMLQDKKIRKRRMIFVLLRDVGQPVLVDDVTEAELAASIQGVGEMEA